MSDTLALVFSRDRALQLDATLRSLLLHCADIDTASVVVLYHTTSAKHQRQYEELIAEYSHRPNVSFVREANFRLDVLRAVSPGAGALRRVGMWLAFLFGPVLARFAVFGGGQSSLANRSLMFLVDDNLFVRPFRLADIRALLDEHQDAIGLSLRLGRNTTYCYPRNHTQRLPVFTTAGPGVLKFSWTTAEGDFGYPLEVSSSVYRAADILPLMASQRFRNPNTLEVAMARRASQFRKTRPFLLCNESSVAFCNPVNMVQTDLPNRAGGNESESSDELAELFAAGRRIDVDAYAAFVPSGCHQEVALHFRHH